MSDPADTMQTWSFIGDKHNWGDGPWVAEPDRAQWTDTTTGLVCLAKRNQHYGFWCGYVGIPPDHPWHGTSYWDDEIDVTVHGDLTYSAECDDDTNEPIQRRICHIPEPGQPEHLWWFGFDCAHAFDQQPGLGAVYRDNNIQLSVNISDWQRYRDLGYVREQCEHLATQLHAAKK